MLYLHPDLSAIFVSDRQSRLRTEAERERLAIGGRTRPAPAAEPDRRRPVFTPASR